MQSNKYAHEYFVIMAGADDNMLLGGIKTISDGTSWTVGQRFSEPPDGKVRINIVRGYEDSNPPDFENVPPVMSDAFYEILLKAGVANLDVYDAILQSKDGTLELSGFKAYNLIGTISATDTITTRFAPENLSRSIDASIDTLVIDQHKAIGALMFRLRENTSTIIVHSTVKEALEAQNFSGVYFLPVNKAIIL
jgi:hypothetical protein